jgi:hypothetical protein
VQGSLYLLWQNGASISSVSKINKTTGAITTLAATGGSFGTTSVNNRLFTSFVVGTTIYVNSSGSTRTYDVETNVTTLLSGLWSVGTGVTNYTVPIIKNGIPTAATFPSNSLALQWASGTFGKIGVITDCTSSTAGKIYITNGASFVPVTPLTAIFYASKATTTGIDSNTVYFAYWTKGTAFITVVKVNVSAATWAQLAVIDMLSPPTTIYYPNIEYDGSKVVVIVVSFNVTVTGAESQSEKQVSVFNFNG